MPQQKEKAEQKSEEIPEHPLWRIVKKIFLILCALFLLYLTISYLGIGTYILNIFEGQLTSAALDEQYTLSLKNQTTIIFTEETYSALLDLFFSNQEHEFAACLYGNYSAENGTKTYTLTSVAVPETYSQTVFRVVSSGCDSETLVFLHSHPYKHCLFSEQDLETHQHFAKKSQHGLSALMCEEDRFTFYGY